MSNGDNSDWALRHAGEYASYQPSAQPWYGSLWDTVKAGASTALDYGLQFYQAYQSGKADSYRGPVAPQPLASYMPVTGAPSPDWKMSQPVVMPATAKPQPGAAPPYVLSSGGGSNQLIILAAMAAVAFVALRGKK